MTEVNDSTNQLPLEQLRQVRIDKVKKLKELGIDSFPSKSKRTHFAGDISKNFDQLENSIAIVAGRIMSFREHGHLVFMDLHDYSGKIQLYIKDDELNSYNKENHNLGFSELNLLDIGDFVQAEGLITKTKRGEVSILVKEIKLLTKSIRPLPSAHFGIKDEDERFRQRYVDFVINPELREMFVKKSKFWNSMRSFLAEKGFLEVETPVLENTAGGADAAPFVTHHNALDIDVYLRISMGELWQKRLMVGGFDKTFEIGRQFRNEGMSREHLQDYTQMEFYWAYADYSHSMALVEEMYKHVTKETFGTLQFEINGFKVDLEKQWEKIDFRSIILEKQNIDISTATLDELKAKAHELKIQLDPAADRGRVIDMLWKNIRKGIAGPAFLIGHPVEVSPLAKRDETKPAFVERYQVILAGSEMGNGYSELNDPIDQAERFQAQQALREAGDAEAQMHDYDFVRALEYGMPPVTGFGVSERLFSFLMDKTVRECVMFPLLKPENAGSEISLAKKYDLFKEVDIEPFVAIEDASKYSIADEVKRDSPGIHFAYVLIKGVEIKKSDSALTKLMDSVLKAQSKISLESLQSIKSIEGYRNIIKNSKSNPTKNRPSPEAMLRRVIQGKGLYNVNTAVDAYNLAVLNTHIGLGGFDYSKVKEPVQLRYSNSGESMHLLGDSEPTILEEGRIIYSDVEKPITLDLNYRDIGETKITEQTKDIILFADGAPGIDKHETLDALMLGATLIQKFCGGEISTVELITDKE
jgi:lysyl-tRNA synthetase class 2